MTPAILRRCEPMSATIDQIQIERETLGQALKTRRLRVDINQREYAWEKDNVEDLCQDFSDVITSSVPSAEHFLGSIVVTRDSHKRSKVVDGQQRLATTMILLAAIRDYLYTHDDKARAIALQGEFLVTVDTDTLQPIPHLTLSANDNPYFKQRILALPDDAERLAAKPERPSHHRINTAAEVTKTWIEREAAATRPGAAWTRLQVWKDFAAERARVIWVEVPDNKTAFRIFETMNDRGLGLSAADLLKNFLFSFADEDMTTAYQQWFQMQGAIESVTDDKKAVLDYIRHFWLSVWSHTVKDELYAVISKRIKSKAEALSLVDSLRSNASLYAALVNPEHNFWNPFPESLRSQVSTLHQLRIAQVRPLLLAGVLKFKVNHKELEKFLRSLVNWSVRFLISGGGGGGVLESRYGAAAREITSGNIKTVKQLTDHFVDVIPPDVAFQADFTTAQVRQVYLAKYYLASLEHQANGEVEPHFDVSKRGGINLEHILPESGKGYDPEIVRSYYTRLGNIALLQQSKNEEIGDKPYAIKSPVLKASKFILTKEAGGKSDWGPEQITKRQKRMAELAVDAWPIRVKG